VSGAPSATSASGNLPAGRYPTNNKETVCDDYWGENKANQIDNDCNDGPNCQDSDCYLSDYGNARTNNNWLQKIGPGTATTAPSVCCNAPAQCKEFLDPSGPTMGAKVECTTNNECNCKAAGHLTPYSSFSGTLRTCVVPFAEAYTDGGNNDVYDRRFAVTGASGSKTFTLTAEDIDGGTNECYQKVELYAFSSSDTQLNFGSNPKLTSDTASGTVSDVSYIYFKSIAVNKDCLIMVKIT
jgi:hypothetical protein